MTAHTIEISPNEFELFADQLQRFVALPESGKPIRGSDIVLMHEFDNEIDKETNKPIGRTGRTICSQVTHVLVRGEEQFLSFQVLSIETLASNL